MNIEKLTNQKEIKKLAFLFMFTYMISYITRTNYGAIISEMVQATSFSKSMLSMSITGSFITYGTGQVISGVLGDKFSPKKLVSIGFIITVLMNVLIPLCSNPYQMLAVWCVNGFAQSFMWPPIVKLMTTFFSDEDYSKATVTVSWGSSFGTIAVYLLAPILIFLTGWRAVFIFAAVCGVIMMFVWNRKCPNVDAPKMENIKKVQATEAAGGRKNILFTPHMLCIMFAIVLQGMLRDGVTTWMPSYISETYNLSSIISILTGVVLPVFSIVCFRVTSELYQRKFKNPMVCAGVIFGVGMVSALALLLFTGRSAACSVLFSALLTGCMHGVNLMLVCMLPAFFQKYGKVSTVSGVLNSCTYVGSAISTYGIAVISEAYSWSFTLLIWVLIAALGTITCFIASRKQL